MRLFCRALCLALIAAHGAISLLGSGGLHALSGCQHFHGGQSRLTVEAAGGTAACHGHAHPCCHHHSTPEQPTPERGHLPAPMQDDDCSICQAVAKSVAAPTLVAAPAVPELVVSISCEPSPRVDCALVATMPIRGPPTLVS